MRLLEGAVRRVRLSLFPPQRHLQVVDADPPIDTRRGDTPYERLVYGDEAHPDEDGPAARQTGTR